MRIMYLLNKFPELSETFILSEIISLLDRGHDIRIFSLLKPSEGPVQEEVEAYNLQERTKYAPEFQNDASWLVWIQFAKEVLNPQDLHPIRKHRLWSLCRNISAGKEISAKSFLVQTAIVNAAQTWGIEHIHCHFASENVRNAYLLSEIMNLPFTFTTHAYDIFKNPRSEIAEWSRKAKRVITISDYNRTYMVDQLDVPSEKLEVIPCGINPQKIMPVAKYNSSKFRIMSLSRLVVKKGYPYLIEACRILKSNGEIFTCEIIGGGPEAGHLLEMITQMGLQDIVKLSPSIPRNSALDRISTASVFVLPCIVADDGDRDGIPVALMEAMALAIPVISTPVAGVPELIDDGINGFLVPEKSSAALAETICRVKNNPMLAEKLGRLGRQKIESHFKADFHIDKLVRLFCQNSLNGISGHYSVTE